MSASPQQLERNTITLSDGSSDVTFSDTSGNSQYETFFDLVTPVGVEYRLVPASRLAGRSVGLFMRLNLQDSGNNALPDSAGIRIIVQSPIEEDEIQVGGTTTLRHFNNASQFNDNEVFRLELEKEYRLKEDRHLKIQVNSGTAVTASNSWAQLEIVRLTG